MPRITNQHYLYRHSSLRTVWQTWPDLFRLLTPSQQRTLHRYYRPSDRVSSRELLKHRQQLDKAEPSLGSRAGKAFLILHRAFQDICELYSEAAILDGWAIPHYLKLRLAQPGGSVSGILRPEVDLTALTGAVRLFAAQLAAEQRARAQRFNRHHPLQFYVSCPTRAEDSTHRSG